MMGASIPTLALFVWYVRRRDAFDSSALVEPSLFRVHSFVTGVILNLVFEAMFIGYFLIFTLTLQAGLGFSVLKAALTGIPFAIGISVSIGLISQKLLPKFGRNVIIIGTSTLALGLAGEGLLVLTQGTSLSPWALAVPLLVGGFGIGAIMAPIFAVVLRDVDVAHAGSASGIMNAVQQVGGAIGVALIGVIFFGLLTSSAKTQAQGVTDQLKSDLAAAHLPAPVASSIADGFVTCFVDRSAEKDASVVPESCMRASSDSAGVPLQTQKAITTALAKAGKQANASNFSHAFARSLGFEGILIILVTILTFSLPKSIKPEITKVAA